jgi:hypothetical protein
MVQRISAIILILFAVAALILVLLTVGDFAIDHFMLDFYIRPLPWSAPIFSLLVLLCIGLFWLWRVRKR